MINHSDEAIISDLREKRGSGIDYLYDEYFPVARSIVVKNSAGNMRQGHVGNRGIEHLHEGRQRHRHGDQPRIHPRLPAYLESRSGIIHVPGRGRWCGLRC